MKNNNKRIHLRYCNHFYCSAWLEYVFFFFETYSICINFIYLIIFEELFDVFETNFHFSDENELNGIYVEFIIFYYVVPQYQPLNHFNDRFEKYFRGWVTLKGVRISTFINNRVLITHFTDSIVITLKFKRCGRKIKILWILLSREIPRIYLFKRRKETLEKRVEKTDLRCEMNSLIILWVIKKLSQ